MFSDDNTQSSKNIRSFYSKLPVLDIDELGEAKTNFEEQEQFMLIDERYRKTFDGNQNMITVLASNLKIGDLHYRIADRLKQGSIIHLTGKSKRPSLSKQK